MLQRPLSSAIWLAFICASFSACEYQLSEVNPVEVDETPKTQLSLSALAAIDTLLVYQYTSVNYGLEVSSGYFYELQVYINNEEIYSSTENKGSFTLSPYKYERGIYDMRYDVYTSSGTNSLADLAGAEQLLFQKKLKVIFDKDPPNMPEGLTISKNEAGYLVLKWNKDRRYNFKKYVIEKYFNDEAWPYYNGRVGNPEVIEVNHANDTTYIDSTYFGNNHIYKVFSQSLSDERSSAAEVNYYEPAPEIVSFFPVDGHKLQINWTPTQYPSLFQKYRVINRANREVLFESGSAADTFCIIEGPVNFGGSFMLELNTIPVYATEEEITDNKYNSAEQVFFGEKAKPHDQILPTADGKFFMVAESKLFKLDEQLHPTDSLTSLYFWETNLCIPESSSIYSWYGKDIYLIDATNLDLKQQMNLNTLLGSTKSNFVSNMTVQDNGDFYIRYHERISYSQSTPYFGYYNAAEDSLYTINTGIDVFDNILSGSKRGHLVAHYNNKTVAIRLEKDSILEIREIASNISRILPIPSSPDKFALHNQRTNTLETWRFEDFTKESELLLSIEARSLAFTADSNLLTATTHEEGQNFLYLIEVSSGSIVLQVDLWEDDYSTWPGEFTLINKWIYSASGYKLNIENLLL